jgi:hypothetical protein
MDELELLRQIYGDTLCVFGIFAPDAKRRTRLINDGVDAPEVQDILDRDQGELATFGQMTRKVFVEADFFVCNVAGGRRVMAERVGLEVETLTIRILVRLQRLGGRKLIVTPEGAAVPTAKPSRDETLVKALVRAHRWRRKIESGQAKSVTDLAEQEGVAVAYVRRLLPLTCLAPDTAVPFRVTCQPCRFGSQGVRRRDSGASDARLGDRSRPRVQT